MKNLTPAQVLRQALTRLEQLEPDGISDLTDDIEAAERLYDKEKARAEAAEARVKELEAEREKWKHLFEAGRDMDEQAMDEGLVVSCIEHSVVVAQRDRLASRVEMLRRAVEPFARIADDFDADGRDLKDSDGIYANTAGDFRTARAAYEETNDR